MPRLVQEPETRLLSQLGRGKNRSRTGVATTRVGRSGALPKDPVLATSRAWVQRPALLPGSPLPKSSLAKTTSLWLNQRGLWEVLMEQICLSHRAEVSV